MVFIDVLRKLRVIVNSDSYRLGTPLPAERILAENLQASRSTVRKAINVLVENGLIERKQGFGNVVINKDPRHSNKQLHSFTEHMAALGRKPHTQVVKFELRVATQGIADILKINVGESLYYVRRVRYAGKQAIEVEDSYLPLNLYRGISIEDLEASKYDYIEGQLGIKIKGCAYTFDAMHDKEVCSILNISENTILLKMICFSDTYEDKIIDYSEIMFNPKDYKVDYYVHR